MFFNELVTANDVRSEYQSIVATTDDALFLKLIRDVSHQIHIYADRHFVPRIQTRSFDYARDVQGRVLTLDRDLLAVTTLTNGDSNTVASTKYVFEPRNEPPYYAIRLLGSAGVAWTYTNDVENAITLAGVWGYHTEYADAWSDTAATLAAAITTTSATTFTCTTGLIKAGMLLKIDSEYLYTSSVSTGASDTVTVSRAANGSTAATHLISTAISVWAPIYAVRELAREGVAGLYRLRANPLAETFVAPDGTTFVTPRDVSMYLEKRIEELGLKRN